jgi:hypothetical protein
MRVRKVVLGLVCIEVANVELFGNVFYPVVHCRACNGLAEGRGHVLGAALLRSVCSSQVFMQDSKRQ